MEQYFTWIMLVYMLIVYAITRALRDVTENVWPDLKLPTIRNGRKYWGALVWQEMVLPTAPVVVGVLFAHFVKAWPMPAALNAPVLREILGGCVGFTSAWGFRIFKAIVKKTWNVDLSDPPDALPGGTTVILPPNPSPPQITVNVDNSTVNEAPKETP